MLVVNHKSNVAVVLKQFGRLDARAMQAASKGLKRGLTFTVARAQTNYLQGPRPAKLGEKTGRLLRSITSRVIDAGDRVRGEIGTNVVYGAFHEFGFQGSQSIKAHSRKPGRTFLRGGVIISEIKLKREGAFKKDGTLKKRANAIEQDASRDVAIDVQAHSRRIDYKGRPFIRPALKDTGDVIIGEIRKELSTLSNQPSTTP